MFCGLRVVTSRFGGIRWFHIIEHCPNWSAIAHWRTLLSFIVFCFSLFGQRRFRTVYVFVCALRLLRRRLTTGDAVLTCRTDPERSTAQKSPSIYANKCIAMKVKSQSTERRTDERRTSEWEDGEEEGGGAAEKLKATLAQTHKWKNSHNVYRAFTALIS